MTSGIYIPLICLFFQTLLVIIYFSKERIHSIENKIFKILILSNLIGLIIEIACFFAIRYSFFHGIVNMAILKSYLIYLLTFLIVFTAYVFVISSKYDFDSEIYKSKAKKLKNISLWIYWLIIILVCFLPLNIYYDGSIGYTYGSSVQLLYFIAMFFSLIWIIKIVANIKQITHKRFYPLIVMIVFGSIAMLIQYFHPSILLMTGLETFVLFIMYHTIENPDMKMINQLELAKDQADKANRAKTDFLSSMSHEIRTPLNAIMGFSQCIEVADTLEEAKENANDIINASKTLLEIVNGILDISKIEAGKMEIVNSPYNSEELFMELAKLMRPKMNEKALDFQVHIAEDLPKVLYGDHTNLKKVVTNLLSNAYKYTDKGYVKYEVSCFLKDSVCKLVISIEDSGRGIKQEKVDKLFTKFQRLDDDKNTTIEGTGLGLAITKQLLELMGGNIIVHTVYGEGSKFTVCLNQRIEKVEILMEEEKISKTLDLTDKIILVVDDNKLNLKVASRLLDQFNGKYDLVESGTEAIEKIKNNEYDLILLDDMMPKMSGRETFVRLRNIKGFNTPVVMLTANAINGMREKYLKEGFTDYIPKPIERDVFIQVLNKVFDEKRQDTLDFGELPKEIFEIDEDILDRDSKDVVIVPEREEIEQEEVKQDEIKQEEIKQVEEKQEEIKQDEIKQEEINQEEIDQVEVKQEENLEALDSSSEEKYDEIYLREHNIDMDNALSLLGDIEMYNMTLKDFLDEIDERFVRITKEKEESDMENYSIDVHSLKSDSKYLGLMKLADIAYQHELKSKEKDIEFVNNNFDLLKKELDEVLLIVKEYSKHI